MQTILGANGVIAKELAKELTNYTNKIRLVSRNPQSVNKTDEIFSADLLNAGQTESAVKGSETVYLTVGLPYNTKIWQQKWPVIMQNVINACKKSGVRLVIFDNVYMYGKVNGWMTEDSAYHPISKKGEVRKEIAEMLMNEVKKGNISALIARAADFYGPGAPGIINATVFENYAKGKKAQWLINDNVSHSFTFTPDAGKATALLGNTETAYNQVWHLPTDKNALTGKEIITKISAAFNAEPKYQVISKWMLKMVSIFNSVVKENIELQYQNEYPYLFDSSKFEKTFNDFRITSYDEGIKITADSYRK